MTYDIAIVGAGASGLAAGIAAGRALAKGAGGKNTAPTGRVLLLERMPRAGKKILATGNGRCNLGNRRALEHPYHNRDFAAPALKQFEGCEAFFDSLGLAVREDGEGRLYPRPNMAAGVLDALRFGAERAGCETRCGCPATSIEPAGRGFLINKEIFARRVIVAAGGCAAPAQGSDGSGFSLLRSLGHRIVEPRPALVQIKAKSPVLAMLKGMRVQAGIRVVRGSRVLREAAGEVLFAQDGLSGIAAMEASREAAPGTAAVLDLLPEYSIDELTALLSRWQGCLDGYSPAQLLAGLLPGRVAQAVARTPCGPPPSGAGGLAYACKNFAFEVTGTRGFAHAQVTAGGADVAQFEAGTMESRAVPGVYACGEALDVDGGCGGFNLQWAWASGVLAGQSAAG
ncbi:MAG: aminoacetone oxidase family FAD-binding enzyme [Oscillospiraceae bacterium]|nr:aminoacetone oxidase family FAD-binding enzyme [Oscillospiraceae bacterium]